MIKKIFLSALIVLISAAASAAPDLAALRDYAAKSLSNCEDNSIALEPIDQAGPVGFLPYRLTHRSSDSSCGGQAFLLFSPTTGQIIIGSIFALPFDNRSVEVRLTEGASALMQQSVTASINPFPLPDGLRAVTITKQTQFGPFSYRAYIDSSQQFMIVGERGSLYVDPHSTLVESIGLENAVRRGNPKAGVKIIELSDFECPTCGKAHKTIEPLIEKHLVRVDYYRLDLPLFENHEWSLAAALGARAIEHVAPAKYWAYVNFVFQNQESIGKRAFTDVLKNFCEDNDVQWAAINKVYSSPQERASLLDQVSRAYALGITSTPTYIVNGQILGYGPSGEFTIAAIKKALGVK